MVELGTRRTDRKGAGRKLSAYRLRAPHFYPKWQGRQAAGAFTRNSDGEKRRFALLFTACDLVMTFFGGIEYGVFDRSHRFECAR